MSDPQCGLYTPSIPGIVSRQVIDTDGQIVTYHPPSSTALRLRATAEEWRGWMRVAGAVWEEAA